MTAAPDPDAFNLAAHVLGRAGDLPDKIAMAVLGPARAERWSFSRLEGAVRGTATGLLRRGLEPGDRVLLRLGNSARFPVAYLGAITAGLIPVPTSAQLTGREVTAIAGEVRPALTLADDGVSLPEGDWPVLESAALSGFADLPPAPYALGSAERPAYIIYTSGTGGRPRAVVHAHRAILARQMMMDGWYGLGEGDRLLHAGAFNWTYTLGTGLMDPWTRGATALIPAPGTDAEMLPLLLKRHDATIFAAAPGVYRRLLRAEMPAMPHLRHGLSAGEKLGDGIRTRWREVTGTDLHEAYGMSECSTFLSGSPARPAPPGTLGFAQPGRRIALLSDGAPVAEGETGTIAIHRSDPGLMLGYLDQPEETAVRYAGDWFLTGDLARQTPDGAYHYEGRADDMMNAGGYRVSPIEVEEVLAAHPGIAEAAAVMVAPKPDTTIIAAFWSGPEALDDAALSDWCAQRLARYKCPRLFLRLDSLPRGTNNKLLRRALRQDWEASHGQT